MVTEDTADGVTCQNIFNSYASVGGRATIGAMARGGRPAALPEESVDADRVLAFVNTLSSRPTASPVERLVSYDALVEWAREQHLIAGAAADRLGAEARRRPHQAAAVLARAKEFREALNGLAAAIDDGRQPSPATLETISGVLSSAYAHGRLVPHEGALQWVSSTEDDLERIVWEVARAAGRLVVSPRLARIRACAASDCGWWFVDDTKNRSRRWCDMKICGNREKVRRFRQKS